MADQDDFTFDEQDGDSEEWLEEEAEQIRKKGGSPRRLLLLLLLLVVLAAAAYFFVLMPQDDGGPAAPPKVVVNVKKKPIAIPPKPVDQAQATADKTVEMTKKPEVPTAPAETATPAPAPEPPVTASANKTAPTPPVSAEVVEKPATSVPDVSEKKVFETKAAPAPAPAAPAMAPGAYTLTAGTYLLDSSIRSVSKKIRALGYEPDLTPVKRTVTMTRLKVGTYPVSEAKRKIDQLHSKAPDAFGIRHGDMETVYVGSYFVIDKARHFADLLYRDGITLEEEQVEVQRTLQRVTFGSFASADDASVIARKAATRGLEAKVLKNRQM